MTKEEILTTLREQLDGHEEFRNSCMGLFDRWLSRGDGVAVYENQAFDSSNLGHKQFVSYGSPVAQIETAEPPQRMPDIGNSINWAYQLVGKYRLTEREEAKVCNALTST